MMSRVSGPVPTDRGDREISNGCRHVMIWVGHRAAVVAVFVGSFPSDWLEVCCDGPHPERIRSWLVYGLETHARGTLKSFHDEIIQHLKPADSILLLGPGQPKHQLAKFINDHSGRMGSIAQTHTMPRLDGPELIACAEAFFGAADGQEMTES
jgi:hypothetical protein